MQTQHDGSQSWAWVRNGIITSGGRNERPKTWQQMGARTIDFYTSFRFQQQFGKTPATKQFQQTLQQTHLTESYNGSHPNRPVAARGATSGQIGGVGHKLGMIEGLFDHPEALFEREHFFMVPMEGEKVPFSERELKQILRELAIGIYAHETVPFFSLEFNQDGHLFPVIHPVYEGTLVGRVIGMLDYMMKGFLNGGVFHEKFVDGWRAHPNWDRMSAVDQMVTFSEYVKREGLEFGKGYQSFRLMIENYLFEKKKKLESEDAKVKHDPEFFEDYTRFSNSFRIIAKQSGFKKGESLFLLDGDFDVFYTLQPDPEYQKRLGGFREEHGRDPLGYVALDKCAKKMCERIHDQMRRFPMFEEYFSMLNVINFFSSYFMTLKAHDTIPYLPPLTLTKDEEKRCPSVFPELPVLVKERRDIREHALISQLRYEHFDQIKSYLLADDSLPLPGLKQVIKDLVWKDLSRKKTVSLAQSIFGGVAMPSLAIIPLVAGGMVQPVVNRMNKERYALLSAAIAASFYAYSNATWYLSDEYKQQQVYLSDKVKFDKELDEFITDFLIELKTEFLTFRMEYSSIDSKLVIHQFFDQNKGNLQNYLDSKLWSDPSCQEGQREVSLPVLKPSVDAGSEDRAVSRTIAGGCGMDLKGQRVETSDEAKVMLEEKWPQLMQEEGETWSVMTIPGSGKKGAVFRLMIDQAPTDQVGYEWMENLLQVEGESVGGLEKFHGVVDALARKNWEDFKERLDAIAPFSVLGCLSRNYYTENIRDRMGRNLLHFSALLEDPSYSKEIVERNPGLALEVDFHGFLPIHYAAMEGHVNQIKYLNKWSVFAVDRKSYAGMTPLMVAVQHGHVQAVYTLLTLEAELDGVTAGGYTSLMIAVHEGDFEMTRYLLELEEIDVNAVTGRKVSALMLAAELKDVRIMSLLLEKGANPNAKDRAGNTALNVAIQSGNMGGIKVLASKTVYQKEMGIDLAKHGTAEMARVFVGQWTTGDRLIEMIYLGVEYANEEVALTLLDYLLSNVPNGVEMAVRYLKGVDKLFVGKGEKIIERLVEAGVSFDGDQWIVGLCLIGDSPFVRESLRAIRWDEVDQEVILKGFENLLHQGHTTLLPFYLELTGLELDEKRLDSKGWEYPHYLAKLDARDLLREWVEEHEDCLYPVKGGESMTLPYIAAEEGSFRTLDFLLEWMKEEDIPLERHYGESHLLLGAFESYDEKVVLRTLAFCPDVDAPLDLSMRCAAHFAARQNRVEVLKEIARRRGNLEIRDREGRTPLEVAFQSNSYEAAACLISLECPVYSTDVDAIEGPDKEKMSALIKPERVIPFERAKDVPDPLTEELDSESLKAFLGARTLGERIAVAKTLPLEKMVPASEAIFLRSPLPLIFYLIQMSIKAHKSYQQQLIPLILQVGKEFPQLRDTRGNTLSHMIVLMRHVEDVEAVINLKERNMKGQTPLHVAALESSEKPFNLLIELADSTDLEAIDHQGQTPLFYAVGKNRSYAVNALISRKADVNHRDHVNRTPFVVAFSKKHSKVLFSLLNVCDIDQLMNVGDQEITPLKCLAASNSSQAFIYALEHHPVSETKAKRRKGIPHLLAEHGDFEGTRQMMRAHRSLFFERKEGLYPWDLAAMRGHQSLVEYFWREIPELFEYGSNLLRYAALGGQRDIAAFLVQKGILNHLSEEEKERSLTAAAASNCQETMRFFTGLFVKGKKEERLFRGVSKAISSAIVNKKGRSLSHLYDEVGFPSAIELGSRMPGLHLASLDGSVEAVKYLASRSDVDPYQKGRAKDYTAIETAAEGADPARFRYLLEKVMPPIDLQNDRGQTLLHIAARSGRFPHVMLLLDQGYQTNIRDAFGLTPQEIAAIEGRFDILRLLLFTGADEDSIRKIEAKANGEVAKKNHLMGMYQEVLKVVDGFKELCTHSAEGETALHLAVKCRWKPALTVLARSGFLEQQDAKGRTPLHLAAALGNRETLRLLVGQGADVEAQDHERLTPLDVARAYGREDAVRFLEDLKGKVLDVCA